MDFIRALMKAIGVVLICLGVVLMIATGIILAPFVMGIVILVILVIITLILTFMFYD